MVRLLICSHTYQHLFLWGDLNYIAFRIDVVLVGKDGNTTPIIRYIVAEGFNIEHDVLLVALE